MTIELNPKPLRSLELSPPDLAWATWRKRQPLPRPAPRPFDQAKALAHLARTPKFDRSGFRWNWSRLDILLLLSKEEAHFWFTAISEIGHVYFEQIHRHSSAMIKETPKLLVQTLGQRIFDGQITADEIQSKLPYEWVRPEIVLPLYNLLPLETLYNLISSGVMALPEPGDKGRHHLGPREVGDILAVGLRTYLLPFLTEAEVNWLQTRLRPALRAAAWPKNYEETPPPVFRLAACLGMHQEISNLVNSWPDDLYQAKDRPDKVHQPQEIIFGLGSARAVEAEMRRLQLPLKRADHIQAWLAHTGYTALDLIYDSLRAEPRPTVFRQRLKAFARVSAPEAAPYMLALMLASPAPHLARQWLDSHPEQAIIGLIPLSAGRGKVADTALSFLDRLKQSGYEALVQAGLEQFPADITRRLRTKVIEAAAPVYPSFDEQTTPDWLRKALPPQKLSKVRQAHWISPVLLPPIVVGQHCLSETQVAGLLKLLKTCSLSQPAPQLISLKAQASAETLEAFAWQLFELWRQEGLPGQGGWIVTALGLWGGNATALKLATQLRRWEKKVRKKWARPIIACLQAIGTDTALMQLHDLAQSASSNHLRIQASQAIETIACQRQLTREQLGDRVVPTCGLAEPDGHILDFGPRRFYVVLGPELNPLLRDEAGRVRTTLPQPGPKDDADLAGQATRQWRLLKRQLQQVARLQAIRLEQALATGRQWSIQEFETLLVGHPVMGRLAWLLLWGGYDTSGRLVTAFRVQHTQHYTDLKEEIVDLSGLQAVKLVHPLELSDETRLAWAELFSDDEIIAPFSQLGREIYQLEREDLAATTLTRFAPVKLMWFAFINALERQGWQRVDQLYIRDFYRGHVSAVVKWDHEGTYQVIKQCAFVPTRAARLDLNEMLPLREVDPVVISETLRDLAMVSGRGKTL